jgi:Holliday junction DNA helicase RuvA
MISSVRGTVLAVQGTTAVIEVGGVGLSVQVTPQHGLSMRIGTEATVRTTLIVREDDLSLYGFAEAEQLSVFELLRSVTGVGPRSAMGVLAALDPNQIAQAVATEDDAAFRKVSGIGPKTAKLIVLQLAGKLAAVPTPRAAASVAATPVRDSVLMALIGLGWPERTALQGVEDAYAAATDLERETMPSLLRLALAQLGPQQAAGK